MRNSDSDYLSEQEGEADYTLGSEPSVASGSECMSEPDSETDYLNLCLSLYSHSEEQPNTPERITPEDVELWQSVPNPLSDSTSFDPSECSLGPAGTENMESDSKTEDAGNDSETDDSETESKVAHNLDAVSSLIHKATLLTLEGQDHGVTCLDCITGAVKLIVEANGLERSEAQQDSIRAIFEALTDIMETLKKKCAPTQEGLEIDELATHYRPACELMDAFRKLMGLRNEQRFPRMAKQIAGTMRTFIEVYTDHPDCCTTTMREKALDKMLRRATDAVQMEARKAIANIVQALTEQTKMGYGSVDKGELLTALQTEMHNLDSNLRATLNSDTIMALLPQDQGEMSDRGAHTEPTQMDQLIEAAGIFHSSQNTDTSSDCMENQTESEREFTKELAAFFDPPESVKEDSGTQLNNERPTPNCATGFKRNRLQITRSPTLSSPTPSNGTTFVSGTRVSAPGQPTPWPTRAREIVPETSFHGLLECIPGTEDNVNTEQIYPPSTNNQSEQALSLELAPVGIPRTKNSDRLHATWDSGSVSNILNDKKYFDFLDEQAPTIKFTNAAPNGNSAQRTQTQGSGTASIYLKNLVNGKLTRIKFKAHYVPNISVNLLSTGYFLCRNLYWDTTVNTLRTLNGKFKTKLLVTNSNSEGSFMFGIADQRDSGLEVDNFIFDCTTQKKITLGNQNQGSTSKVANKILSCFTHTNSNHLCVCINPNEENLFLNTSKQAGSTTQVATENQTEKDETNKPDFFLEDALEETPSPKVYSSKENTQYSHTKKDYANWKFEKIQEAIDACEGDKPTQELFSDKEQQNSVLGTGKSYSPDDDAFAHSWTDGYFYGNPDYNDAFINKTLTKALWDFSLSPFNTRFMFVLPDWKTASWYPLLRHFDIKKTYPTDSQLFSAQSITKLNPPNSKTTTDGRVEVGGTVWKVMIVYKDCNTTTKIDGAMKLHLMFGHKSAAYIKEAIKDNLTCLDLIKSDLRKLDVPIFCAVCNAAKSRSAKATREYALATRPLESLHCDLKVYTLGSIDGYNYIFGIIDSYTRYAWIYFLKKKSDAAQKLRQFCEDVKTSLSQNNLQGCRLIADNAKEFTGKEFTSVAQEFLLEFKTTAEYKHTDNSMIESFWRNEQVVRSMLLGAPHTDRRLWPYAWLLATKLHNCFPHKYHGQGTMASTDVMQKSPLEAMTGKKPPLASFKPFGLPMKIHIPVEKRNMCADPKLIARSFTGYYLCQNPRQPTKILVQAEDTNNVISTGFYQPMYSVDSMSKIISNANLTNTIDLDTIEENIVKSQISINTISTRKSVHATKITDVSVFQDDNKELVGAVQVEILAQKPSTVWIPAPTFLKGNKDRVFAHKNMFAEFLNKHFQYKENTFYPIFVQTDVKISTPKDKKNPVKFFPGFIVGTDANAAKGYYTALYETDQGKEDVCDLHDCSAKDIVQFEVARILAPCFTRDSDCEDYRESNTLHALLQTKKPLTKRQKTFLNDPTLPQSYKHAMTMPDKDKWQEAFDQEVDGLYKVKNSFTPIKTEDIGLHTDCQKTLRSSVICKRKLDKDGNVKKYKVRLVIGGHDQFKGDGTFDDTFAPTASMITQRLCFTLAVNLGLRPYQLDVEQAFLNADIGNKTILVKLPAGIEIEGCTYVKLLKAVYGLKQSPNLWYKLCYDTIIKCEGRLTRSKTDPCFFHYVSTELIVLMTVTVDDIAIFTNDNQWMEKFKSSFNDSFAITQEPDFTWFLGTKMEWSNDFTGVKLTQPNHIRSALIRYNMMDCKPQSTPMSADFDSSPLSADHVNPDFPYSGIIGTLIWIARISRPDILNAVTLLASHSGSFCDRHIKEAKRVLAYLKGTEDYGLLIKKSPGYDISKPITLKMYSDSDWGRNKTTRRSVTGYVGYLLGSPIVSQSCYQPTVATSSCEAEYMAISNALKEILYFTNVFREVELLLFQLPVSIYIDNTGAIDMSTTQVSNKRTKHIDIRHHLIRDSYEDGTIFPLHVPTEENTADLFTKPLSDALFIKHREAVVSASAP